MKINTKKLLILVCVIILIISVSNIVIADITSFEKEKSISNYLEYILHDPILIDGNEDFVIGQNGVVSGEGTEGDPFVISGWDIDASTAHGIHIKNSNVYFVIMDCIVHDGLDGAGGGFIGFNGIRLENVINGFVDDVNSTRNGFGLKIKGSSSDIFVSNSSFCQNNGGIGLGGSFIYVFNNSISHNGCGIGVYCFQSIIEKNTITYNLLGVHGGYSDPELPLQVTYLDNNISYNAGIGMFFDCSPGHNIINNTIAYNGYDPDALSLGFPPDIIPAAGIWAICESNYVDIINNTITHNYEKGIHLSASFPSRVLYNNISNNFGYGINTQGININYQRVISDNLITYNTKSGIVLGLNNKYCSNTDIYFNIIRDNQEYGIFCNQSSGHLDFLNVVHHNNLINNTLGNAYDESMDTNLWDDTGEGNYWYDYEIRYPDANNDDNIWDTPYEIMGGDNMDRYPLLNLWVPPIVCGDVDNSGGVDIDDVVYLINYIFSSGPPPTPEVCIGDADGSGSVDIDDVVYLINYIFVSGPPPIETCCE